MSASGGPLYATCPSTLRPWSSDSSHEKFYLEENQRLKTWSRKNIIFTVIPLPVTKRENPCGDKKNLLSSFNYLYKWVKYQYIYLHSTSPTWSSLKYKKKSFLSATFSLFFPCEMSLFGSHGQPLQLLSPSKSLHIDSLNKHMNH